MTKSKQNLVIARLNLIFATMEKMTSILLKQAIYIQIAVVLLAIGIFQCAQNKDKSPASAETSATQPAIEPNYGAPLTEETKGLWLNWQTLTESWAILASNWSVLSAPMWWIWVTSLNLSVFAGMDVLPKWWKPEDQKSMIWRKSCCFFQKCRYELNPMWTMKEIQKGRRINQGTCGFY